MNTYISQTNRKEPTWDTVNSTYWWRMQLNPDHPEYTSSKDEILMHGYSKYYKETERHDKYELLQKNCCFLIGEWMDKCHWITLHKRIHAACDITGGGDPAIIILYPNQRYILTSHLVLSGQALENNFQRYIGMIYDKHKAGEDISKYKPGREKKLSKDDYLDVFKHHFRTEDQLNSYTVRLSANGFSNKEIEYFYLKYKETYPHLNSVSSRTTIYRRGK